MSVLCGDRLEMESDVRTMPLLVHTLNTAVNASRSCGCVPPAPASEEHDVASEPEETFSWKNVLKDVLRLREENKLSEGKFKFIRVGFSVV